MKTIAHWVPAGFCAFLSLMALFAFTRSPDAQWWRPAFFSFLPLCFYFVGSVTFQLHREVRALRQQVAESDRRASTIPGKTAAE